jgi:isocitrate/isopropylmalate dehydrogenase
MMKQRMNAEHQIKRVDVALSIRAAQSLIDQATEKQGQIPELAIEKTNESLKILRHAFSIAQEIHAAELLLLVKENVKKSLALQQSIQDGLNESMGFPIMTRETKLDTMKDMIDSLETYFVEWSSKEKLKRDKI